MKLRAYCEEQNQQNVCKRSIVNTSMHDDQQDMKIMTTLASVNITNTTTHINADQANCNGDTRFYDKGIIILVDDNGVPSKFEPLLGSKMAQASSAQLQGSNFTGIRLEMHQRSILYMMNQSITVFARIAYLE